MYRNHLWKKMILKKKKCSLANSCKLRVRAMIEQLLYFLVLLLLLVSYCKTMVLDSFFQLILRYS